MIEVIPDSPLTKPSSAKLQVSLLPPTTVQKLLQKHCQQLLTAPFLKRNKKELGLFVFLFEVKHGNKKWELQKRFNDFVDFSHLMKKKYGRETPGLPITKQSEVTTGNVEYFGEFLLIFLRKALDIGGDDEDVRHFFELMPERCGSGIIHAEVRMKKHSGGRHTEATCAAKFRRTFCSCCRTWRTRYFTVTDECVFYTIHKKTYDIKEMLPFTANFKVLYGMADVGDDLGIIIQSAYRNLQLRSQNLYDLTMFVGAISSSLKKSIYCTQQRYNSFAAVREECFSKYYIDGQHYFSDACDQMMKAQRYIYITDWMLSPFLQLKRPATIDDTSCRLDYVLLSAAQRGVKVNIILYMEPKIALNNDSEYVEFYLTEMHKNIKVLRHPNYILVPFLWSHHEKMIVVDQKCAFMGGLDLCYGRWDTQEHKLHNRDKQWKGADFCNFRISDIYQPRNFMRSNLDEKTQPRMPWHDIAIQIRGLSVSDLTRHFVQYWNFVSFQTKFNERELLMNSGHESVRKSTFFFKREQTSRVMELREDLVKEEQEEQENEYYGQFLDKKFIDFPSINLNEIRKYPKKILQFIKEGEDGNQYRLLFDMIESAQSNKKNGQQIHQILRSASTWSLGLGPKQFERSIYEAYIDLIRCSKEFIYIENQFFIAKKNLIIELLAERILRAHHENKKFRVVIMLPLLPGFEGQVDNDNAAVMRVQLNWQYVTMAHGKTSLLSRLSSIPNVSDYLQVFSLRAHALLEGKNPVTEILYIHSKLMIVDDEKVILGSANINDRSLLGKRDSQIGIVVEQSNLVETKYGRKVSPSAHSLRVDLYKQHFNISAEQADDYHNDGTWDLISAKAERNTLIYRKIFGCYPDNTMETFKDIITVRKQVSLELYKELSPKIDGFVVEWPYNFLRKEDLTLKPSQKEYFVPEMNFT